MAIKAYSYAKDGNRKLSANFAVKEFRCKDGSDPIFIADELVTLLQKIRDHFGKSVTITSAYRTAAHNKAVKGATYSQHCYGKAADIRVEGRVAVVYGVPRLHGAQVRATDLRGGAALAVAALGAEGRSELTGVHHIDRGYQSLEGDLRRLGAEIRRI